MTASPYPTSEDPRDDEQELHLHNLEILTRCPELLKSKNVSLYRSHYSGTEAWQRLYWLTVHTIGRRDRPGLNMQISLDLVIAYEKESESKTLQKAFQLWFRGQTPKIKEIKLLKTRILVCNIVAESGRQIGVASKLDLTSQMLVAARTARTNDRILEIKGLGRIPWCGSLMIKVRQ